MFDSIFLQKQAKLTASPEPNYVNLIRKNSEMTKKTRRLLLDILAILIGIWFIFNFISQGKYGGLGSTVLDLILGILLLIFGAAGLIYSSNSNNNNEESDEDRL